MGEIFTSSGDPKTGTKRVTDLSTFGNTWHFSPKVHTTHHTAPFDHSLCPPPLALLYHIRYCCCWNLMMQMLAFIVRWPRLQVKSMQNYYATLPRCPMSRPVSKVDAQNGRYSPHLFLHNDYIWDSCLCGIVGVRESATNYTCFACKTFDAKNCGYI